MPYDPTRHGPRRVVGPGFHDRVYEVVRQVPEGRVTTYGDVAACLGLRRAARQVGYALAALPASRSDVPWHRVVNSRGQLSERGEAGPSSEQGRRLRREGVRVDRRGRVQEFPQFLYTFAPLPEFES